LQSDFGVPFYGCSSRVEYRSPKPLMGVRISPPVHKIIDMKKVVSFFKESIEELKSNVDWPKYSTLQQSSIVVLLASMIFALLIGVVDYVFKEGVSLLYNL
jgi:preprotein translocase subunit SecE